MTQSRRSRRVTTHRDPPLISAARLKPAGSDHLTVRGRGALGSSPEGHDDHDTSDNLAFPALGSTAESRENQDDLDASDHVVIHRDRRDISPARLNSLMWDNLTVWSGAGLGSSPEDHDASNFSDPAERGTAG